MSVHFMGQELPVISIEDIPKIQRPNRQSAWLQFFRKIPPGMAVVLTEADVNGSLGRVYMALSHHKARGHLPGSYYTLQTTLEGVRVIYVVNSAKPGRSSETLP